MEGAYHHPVSHRPAFDLRADLGDLPRHFVADDLRDGNALIHAALEYMQVGAANATIGDIYADFIWPRLAWHRFPDFDGSVSLIISSLHLPLPNSIIPSFQYSILPLFQ
jgi:hypothetical protein